MDSRFKIKTIASTACPEQVAWLAMHQDYSQEYVGDSIAPSRGGGELLVKYLLRGDRGHYGPLEHPQITLACGFFPHSLVQQLRTHRVGITFDVQSFRYTGSNFRSTENIEDLFYLRPIGNYTDREGKKYGYTEKMRKEDLEYLEYAKARYCLRLEKGLSEEHARGLIPFDVRQHFVMSCNIRSLMHLLDLRWKADAQLEAQWFCDLLFEEFNQWCPAVAGWYREVRGKKARLAP